MADQSYRNRDRYQRESSDRSRQAEQFEDRGYGWRDDERGSGQMGEGWGRDEFGDDDGARSYGREGGWRRDERRQRPDFHNDSPSAYSSGHSGSARFDDRERRGFGSFTGNDQGGADFSDPRFGYGTVSGPYDGHGYRSYGAGGNAARGYGSPLRGDYRDRDDRDERGWFDRAGDEVASWFGDEEAARRREMDHRGRGPSGYTRSDERILEDACDALTRDWRVDARQIQVTVNGGELTLDGTVSSRGQKRRAEDCVEDLSGVRHVQNNLRVQDSEQLRSGSDQTSA